MGSAFHTYSRYSARALLLVTFAALLAPYAEEEEIPSLVKANQAQDIVDTLRGEMSIDPEVEIKIVVYHPFVFAVEPRDGNTGRFQLSIELGFLQMLSERELRAALAHELGHVWIFTHHPFLQTERLANDVGQRVVNREDLERLYRKLWSYEGTPGVPLEDLLGPRPNESP